jgi:hypothetical protein
LSQRLRNIAVHAAITLTAVAAALFVFSWFGGAETFAGVFDNTRLAPRIAGLLGLEPLPRLAGSTQN